MKKIIRFAGVGLVSTILDIFILNILGIIGINVYIATAAGFIAGSTNGYIFNSLLVFKKDRSYQNYAKYFTVSVIGLLLTEVIIDLLHVRGDISVNIAKLVAVGVVFFWNFTLSQKWAFK